MARATNLSCGDRSISVCVVSPFPPPYGGMAVQARELVERLRGEGLQVEAVKTNADLPRFLSGIKGLRTLARFLIFTIKLQAALRRADVVHLFGASHLFFFLHAAPALVMARLWRKRTILNYRGGEAEAFLRRWGWLARPIIRLSDELAVPSPFLRSVFARHGIDSAAILPNLIDLDSFSFKERKEFRPRMLVARQLEKIYNIECVLRAFKIIQGKHPNAHLGVAGTGSREAELKKLAAELGLENVTFYGAVSHEEIAEIYNQYDIYLNASDADNFPGSIMEAFACGLPVVSTRAGGIPCMVEDGATGFLVDVGDCRALAEKAMLIMDNPRLGARIAAAARERCREHSWQSVYKELRQLYRLPEPREVKYGPVYS